MPFLRRPRKASKSEVPLLRFGRYRMCLAVATVAVALLAVGASSASGPQTYSLPSAAQTATLTPAEKQLVASGKPQNIVLDPNTGDIVSVTANTTSDDESPAHAN
jgi:hypothetical protein